ncbi:hypothetical protein BpHYR1_009244, partial [Brachionus plicatilis]
ENDGFNEENFLINDSRGQFENISAENLGIQINGDEMEMENVN